VHGDEVAEAGITVDIALAFEGRLEGVQESVTQGLPSPGLRLRRDDRSQCVDRSNSNVAFARREE
jgi:hypothetical protein